MLQPGSNNLNRQSSRDHILGLNHGLIRLKRLKFGDVTENSRRELINENLITFDSHWPAATIKRYIFEFQSRAVLLQFLKWFDGNIGKFIKIKGPKTIDYGFLLQEGLQVSHNARCGGDIQMNIICLNEVRL